MAKIHYSHTAIRDLEEIGDYIAGTLKNPQVALNTVGRIQDAIDNLAEFPLSGAPLSSITPYDTEYRYLVSGNYLTFYRAFEDDVYIDRVLYGRRDYISVLRHGLSWESSD